MPLRKPALNDNPYDSPATLPAETIGTLWPKWLVNLFAVLFVLCLFGCLMTSVWTLTTSFGMSVSAIISFGSGAAALIFATLAVYGAIRNYRIRLSRLRVNRLQEDAAQPTQVP